MEKIYTKNAPDAIGPYSQAIKANGFVFTSGQIAINPATGKEATYAQRLLVVILGMPTSNARFSVGAGFLRNGWNAWEAWLPTNDYMDRTKFIILPN